ncbi:hypothetical protein MTX20_03835 [Bradyrhizobium sp. ISRA435]|nr:hypothetical protein MTX20_03835 [Bradyrhizobium sp. ISRA435]
MELKTLLGRPVLTLVLLAIFSPTEVLAQQSIFDQLVGEWNHIKENFSIQVRENGDVWMSNAPRARVAGGVIEAGGNFCF